MTPTAGDTGTASPRRVLVVAGLAFEAAIAARRADVDVLYGVGEAAATALRARLRDDPRRPLAIVSFGTAGALDPFYAPGQWLLGRAVLEPADTGTVAPAPGDAGGASAASDPPGVARRHPADADWLARLAAALPEAACVDVAGVNAVVASAAQKHWLHAHTGAAAVDMESAALARQAALHGLPFIVCRVVIDRAGHTLPPAALAGMRADGGTQILPVLASLLRRPAQLPSLLRLGLDAHRARRALVALVRRMPPGFGYAPPADRSS